MHKRSFKIESARHFFVVFKCKNCDRRQYIPKKSFYKALLAKPAEHYGIREMRWGVRVGT